MILRVNSIFIGLIIAFALSVMSAAPSFAQDAINPTEITINDIAGKWRIEVIDRPYSTFKGSAVIPAAEGHFVVAQVITEDKCCGGKNHARVLQDSDITIEDGVIEVDSTIIKYLLREESVAMTYYPDDFELRWQDQDTLIGTANGYTRVRWVRDELEVG